MSDSEPTAYAERRSRLPAPPGIVWDSLVEPHRPRTRPWLVVADDEVEPRVLAAERPVSVLWSSPWPARPDDTVLVELAPHESGTAITYTLRAAGEPPDAATAERQRRRVSVMLLADLRESYG